MDSLFRSGMRKADNALTLRLKAKICIKRSDFGLATIKVEIRYSFLLPFLSIFHYQNSVFVSVKITQLMTALKRFFSYFFATEPESYYSANFFGNQVRLKKSEVWTL